MLKIVTGRIASGKTHLIIEEIGQRIKNKQKSILIVPDPVTYNFEQRLCSQLNINGFIDVEVCSFNRLASSILDFFGKNKKTYLDECAKAMAVRIAISENIEKLTIFKSASKRKGFCERCLDMISTIENCGYTYENLTDVYNKLDNGILKYKLHDMAILYKAYTDILDSGYTDNADKLKTARELLKFYPPLKDTVVYIDGFDVFTSSLITFITELAACTTVTIAISSAENGDDKNAYEIHKQTFDKLQPIAKNNIISIKKNSNRKKKEIRFIEDNFYALNPDVFKGNCDNIFLYFYPNLEAEVNEVAKKIVKGVRYGRRFKDYAVLCNDVKKYSPIINTVFKRYNIPVYLDKTHDITAHPVATYLFSLLKCASIGFTPENVISFALSSLTQLTPDERDFFIGFIKEYGVNSWEIENGLHFKRVSDEMQANFEILRKKFIEPLLVFKEDIMSKQTARQMASLCYKFMEEQGVYEKINQLVDRYEEMELFALSDVTSQLWNKLIQLLESISDLSSSRTIPLSEFTETLYEGFRATPLSTIPTVLDSVTFGDLQATKEQKVPYVFIIGANEGVIPQVYTDERLVTAQENSVLKEMDMELAHSEDTEDARIRFTIYSALSSPAKKLYLSCPIFSSSGSGLRSSYIFKRLETLFPKIKKYVFKESTAQKELKYPLTISQAMLNMAEDKFASLRSKALLEFLKDDDDRLVSILKNEANPKEEVISQELAKSLFSLKNATSITRLETFATCPFKHFIKFGLSPKEMREYTINALDIGTLIHSTLEIFTKENKNNPLTRQQCYDTAGEIFENNLPNVHFGAMISTERQRAFNKFLKNLACEGAWQIRKHISGFSVIGEEISFGYGKNPPIEIKTSVGTIYLKGKIDRADKLDKDGKSYIRIIDYKTGNDLFDRSKVEDGRQLQLMIYMSAMLSSIKNSEPASAQYMRVIDSTFSGPELVDFNTDSGFSRSEFKDMLDTSIKNAQTLTEDMLAGNIKTKNNCEYCSYTAICGIKHKEETNNAKMD